MVVGTPSEIGEIKRDLGALISALGIVGGGGSPNELRSDVGVQVQVGVEETLKRHVDLINADVELVTASAAVLNTTAQNFFSFPEDHYFMGFDFAAPTNPGNVDWMALFLIPQGQNQRLLLGHTVLANRQTFTGITGTDDYFLPVANRGVTFPLFVRAQTDYFLFIRSGAGGGFDAELSVYRIHAPQGVEIAH